jgi:RTA1 like protein
MPLLINSKSDDKIRNIYRTVEFSLMLVNSNDDINEIWLYIFDAAPTFIAIMTLAIVHPFELPYLDAFRRNPGEARARGCVRRTNTERQRAVRTEPARTETVAPPPYVRPPSYREGSISTTDSKTPIKVYDHLQDNIKYYERE